MINWVDYMNRSYIDLYGPPVKIFKLDKEATILDPLYGEESSARIYLPPFDMNMIHLDNPWKQMLGEGTMPYLETEDELTFVCNFNEMVRIIRDLKNKHTYEITLEYLGTGKITVSNLSDIFTIKENGIIVFQADLNVSLYNTSKKLANAINSVSNVLVYFLGDNGLSTDMVGFSEVDFTNQKLVTYAFDPTYENLTDIIETGDLILTNKWKLYEVHTNMPGGDFGWEYSTFVMQGNLRSLQDKASLPENYVEQIKKHEYGLRDRINME